VWSLPRIVCAAERTAHARYRPRQRETIQVRLLFAIVLRSDNFK